MDSAAAFAPTTITGTAPDALDLSHHLSRLSRERQASALKSLYKYFGQPGILQLAGGLPSPDYFPFEEISAQVLLPNTFKTTSVSSLSWLWTLFGRTNTITIPKYVPNATLTTIQLSTSLQYGTALGLPALQKFVREFVEKVFTPGYGNWETILNAGSTDAWSKICTTLMERGDGVLCEEWTYPSALAAAWPYGFRPVPLPMDGEGMTPEGMDELLANWDVEARGGMKRPTVLYTVPVCQNPTGATMSAARKQAVFNVASKWDVIIVEDDPYYFLQAGEYSPPPTAFDSSSRKEPKQAESDEDFLKSLVPSYLKFDTEGRVIRIDTFSKTICPGSRLGFITANPLFCERMLRANESSTQAPCGFGQALVTKLLVEEWGMTGYLRWLKGLKAQYRSRRNILVDSLLSLSHAGLDTRSNTPTSFFLSASTHSVGIIREKDSTLASRPLISFVAPQGGMFVWLRIHFSEHEKYANGSKTTAELTMELWELIAQSNVLVAPGTMFSARTYGEVSPSEEVMVASNGDGFFRLAFSTASEEQMKVAAGTIGKVVKEYFQ